MGLGNVSMGLGNGWMRLRLRYFSAGSGSMQLGNVSMRLGHGWMRLRTCLFAVWERLNGVREWLDGLMACMDLIWECLIILTYPWQ